MKILHAIGSLNPVYGGTTFGLRGLVTGLIGKGHETAVIVLDDPASPWLEGWPCPVYAMGTGSWPYGFNPRFEKKVHELAPNWDHVIVHGLWRYHGEAVRRACLAADVPYSIFPHGMLDGWFASAYPGKHVFKQLYWWFAQGAVLRDASAVFFTTHDEFESGRDTFRPFQARPAIAPFGIQAPSLPLNELIEAFHQRVPGLRARRTILFLGRLHPKKGCDLLINGFARWCATLPSGQQEQWHLRLVGPPESTPYFQLLQELAVQHDLLGRGLISFAGSVSGLEKWQELAQADVLALPSHQENFGVVIAEAMACRVPALISFQVNGWRQINDAGAGLVEADTVEGVVAMLARWEAMTEERRAAMREAAHDYFQTAMSAEVGVNAVLSILQKPGNEIPLQGNSASETTQGRLTEKPLQVLHVIATLAPSVGGPSFALPLMADGLQKHGVTVDVACTDDDGRHRRLPGVIAGQPVARGLHRVRYFPKQTEAYRISLPLWKWLFGHVRRYDLVHIHGLFGFASSAAGLAAWIKGVPYVIRPLGSLNRWGMKHRRPLLKKMSFLFLEKPLLDHAVFIHYTSNAEASEAARLDIGSTPVVLPLGVTADHSEPNPDPSLFWRRFPDTRDHKTILFLSRIDRKKGLDLLIEAMPLVLAAFPNALLIVAGSGDEHFIKACKGRARELGIDTSLVWCGFIDGDLKLSAFAAATLFVLPSYSENFGLAMLEAMISGLPCVASKHVALAQNAAPKNAAVFCDVAPSSIARVITDLLSDEVRRQELGRNARRLAIDEFSSDTMTRTLKTLYSVFTHRQ